MSQKELESIKDDKYMDRLKEEVVEVNNDEEKKGLKRKLLKKSNFLFFMTKKYLIF